MWTLTGALLLSCHLWATHAQVPDGEAPVPEAGEKKSVWDNPIQFVTKGKDKCSMMVTGQGDLTKLRVSCQGQNESYWCEFHGKPHICRQYNTNPRHYFTQIMWDLRKLRNACQGQVNLKPTMCKKASDRAQLALVASSLPAADTTQSPTTKQDKPVQPKAEPERSRKPEVRPDQPRPEQPRREPVKPVGEMPRSEKPSKPQTSRTQPDRPEPVKIQDQGKPVSPKPKDKTSTVAPPTTTKLPATTTAERLAKQHCWSSVQTFCSYVIGWFN